MTQSRFRWICCSLLIAGLVWAGTLAGQVDSGAIQQVPGNPGKLSLELKGMDVLDVLRLLSIKSGLNIVAGANVRGRVTLFLKEVDPWDAFVIILETNNPRIVHHLTENHHVVRCLDDSFQVVI